MDYKWAIFWWYWMVALLSRVRSVPTEISEGLSRIFICYNPFLSKNFLMSTLITVEQN